MYGVALEKWSEKIIAKNCRKSLTVPKWCDILHFAFDICMTANGQLSLTSQKLSLSVSYIYFRFLKKLLMHILVKKKIPGNMHNFFLKNKEKESPAMYITNRKRDRFDSTCNFTNENIYYFPPPPNLTVVSVVILHLS